MKPAGRLKSATARRGNRPWARATLVVDRARARTPRIVPVIDSVHCATGYALGNAGFVATENGVVVIDTTESLPAACAVLRDFRKICGLPITHVIYTHHHGDHVRGAKRFCGDGAAVIAHELLPQEIARKDMLLPFRRRLVKNQFAGADAAGARVNVPSDPGYVPPAITFGAEHRFEMGGVVFELFHTEGETLDHLMVWLPEKRVLFPGDLFYGCFPMLSSPMKPDRSVSKWADSLDRMRALRPEYLVPSHGTPLRGGAEIDGTLETYARAIRHVHDETVRCINAGKTVEEASSAVKLPDDLARLPYLREKYGKVAWAVRGIYRQYTGWYSFNPTDLNPHPDAVRHRTLLRVCGGPRPLLNRAKQALRRKNFQLVLELAEIVSAVRPANQRAVRLRLAALRNLAAQTENNVERNIYRNAAKSIRARIAARMRRSC
jgi:alkyl sulfatase BDS1-like metallo-beta-lactamase superfamily hydrolase